MECCIIEGMCCSPSGRKKKKGRVPDLLVHQTQGSMNTIKLCGKLVSTYKVLSLIHI